MPDTITRPMSTEHTRRSLSPAWLVGAAIALSTGVQLAIFGVGMFVASKHDINKSEGVKGALESMSVVGAVCLAVGLTIALTTRSTARRGKIAAITLGALSVLSIPVYWAGGPAIFGSLAVWRSGLTENGQPRTGAARAFGIIGLVAAVLNVVAILVLSVGSVSTKGYSG
ncbi:MAG: hypothetical protein JO147_09155 [Actinobacteria bacterium]|nr:hypothetical protein [Actinomycetota bacterium]